MANWINSIDLSKARELCEDGKYPESYAKLIERIKTLHYSNWEDQDLLNDLIDELEMGVPLPEDNDDPIETFDDMLTLIYDFGDTVSPEDTGENWFNRKKLLWVKPS